MMICDEIWIVLKEHDRYLHRGKVVRMTRKTPALERGEKAIKVNIKIPDNFFKEPEYQLTIDISKPNGYTEQEVMAEISEALLVLLFFRC